MPEEQTQVSQSGPTPPGNPTSLAQTPSTTHVSWAKVILTVLIIVIVTAIIAGAYWYFLLSKSTGEVDTTPIKVSTPSAKKATSSATPSAKKDETADWKTFEDRVFGFSLKHPPTWFVDLAKDSSDRTYIKSYDPKTVEGRGYDPVKDKGRIKIDIYTFDPENETLEQYIDNFLSSTTSVGQVKTETSKKKMVVDGNNAFKFEYRQPDGLLGGVIIQKENKFYAILGFLDYETNKETFDLIVSTFKFLPST